MNHSGSNDPIDRLVRLLAVSEFNRFTIICVDDVRRREILDTAKVHNYIIPVPVTVKELVTGRLASRDFIVDESESVLIEIVQSLTKQSGGNKHDCESQ